MTAPVIMWFRQDLRLTDNPALSAAVETGASVLPLYIFDDQTPWPPGAASRWWLHHSLNAFDMPLILRAGNAEKVLFDVIKKSGAQAVYWNRQYEPHAIKRDTSIKTTLKERGIDVQSFKSAALFEPWEIKPYKVFTPFYKACLGKQELNGAPIGAPKKITYFKDDIDNISLEDLKLLPDIPWDSEFKDSWTPGEDGALERAQIFIDEEMSHYKQGRDRPDKELTSRLSPHLHFGEISPRMLWHMAGPHQGSESFLRELIWREFSIHLLYHHPQLPAKPLQEKFAKFPWQKNKKHLERWQRGMTGYPIVDAGMRQLWQTGWMHNRVRMIVGSFLVKHLLLPWQHGEAWFWDCLVDADLANNAASWQWIAGCGADAAPYFRVFNPTLQGEKFDPNGDYVRRFVPELRDVPDQFIHEPWKSALKLDYPAPIVDHAAGRARALEAFGSLKGL